MEYSIAIPSYHREHTIQNKTLKVLESYNIDPAKITIFVNDQDCLLYTSPSPRDRQKSRMPSSA